MKAVMKEASARHVPAIFEFHAVWCYSCYYMEEKVQKGPRWAALRKRVLFEALDIESPAGRYWMKKWKVGAFPTYVVVDDQGQEIGRIVGEKTADLFYQDIDHMLASRSTLPSLRKAAAAGGSKADAAAASALSAYLAREDVKAGLAWFASLPAARRKALDADPQVALLVERLKLHRAADANDPKACLAEGRKVLAHDLGCNRALELKRVLKCTAHLPAAEVAPLLKTQREPMQKLFVSGVLDASKAQRCADERTITLSLAKLQRGLGDDKAATQTLRKAIASGQKRLHGDYAADRNLAEIVLTYYQALPDHHGEDAMFRKLVKAFPDDYVFPYYFAQTLHRRGDDKTALPYIEKADKKAYGINRLYVAELHAKILAGLGRAGDGVKVLSQALQTNGPWFPDQAMQARDLMTQMQLQAH
jgi:Thiol:disulfide interchange protein